MTEFASHDPSTTNHAEREEGHERAAKRLVDHPLLEEAEHLQLAIAGEYDDEYEFIHHYRSAQRLVRELNSAIVNSPLAQTPVTLVGTTASIYHSQHAFTAEHGTGVGIVSSPYVPEDAQHYDADTEEGEPDEPTYQLPYADSVSGSFAGYGVSIVANPATGARSLELYARVQAGPLVETATSTSVPHHCAKVGEIDYYFNEDYPNRELPASIETVDNLLIAKLQAIIDTSDSQPSDAELLRAYGSTAAQLINRRPDYRNDTELHDTIMDQLAVRFPHLIDQPCSIKAPLVVELRHPDDRAVQSYDVYPNDLGTEYYVSGVVCLPAIKKPTTNRPYIPANSHLQHAKRSLYLASTPLHGDRDDVVYIPLELIQDIE